MSARQLKIRREDTCVRCAAVLPVGTEAWWDKTARTVTCTDCFAASAADAAPVPPQDELNCEDAGANLDRESDRRRRNREQRTRAAHPHLGGLLLAMRGTPQHEAVFHQGAVAERAVAESLRMRTGEQGVITLHNRRMPGGRGDIDHIAIAPSGVYVIDTKDWKGKVEIERPWFGSPKLLIGRRDRTGLIDGLERQLTVVRTALDQLGHQSVPLPGALCFTKADLPLLRPQEFRGHMLLYRRALAKRLNREGPLDPARVEALARQLAVALPSAR